MPIHPQDLSDYVAMFGEQLIPEGFEEEYEIQLNMSHRRGQVGPLGSLMVPLCRQFGLVPPESKKASEQVLWRKVARNSPVKVTLNGITKKGTFVGLGPYGEVEVVIEGQAWVQAVKPFQVELDDTLSLSPDLKLSPAEKQAMQPFVAQDEGATVIEDTLPNFNPEAVDEDEAPPKMADESWYSVEPGARLMVDLGDDLPDGKFVSLGPSDGYVSVEVGDDILFLAEDKVTIA